MAVNVNNVERKMFKYYEGLCSSADFPKEIAKVLALGVKTDAIKDIDGKILEDPVVVKSKNWDIVYPRPDSSLGFDSDDLPDAQYKAKILNQVNKISDTVILKTTTTAKALAEGEYDDLTVDSTSNDESLTMYLEIYKPAYIANPEEYPLDCERKGIIPKLITKDLYEESLKVEQAAEENIYINIATKETLPKTTAGELVDLTYEQCSDYVEKIQDIYGNASTLHMPQTEDDLPYQTINTSYLARVKQESAELYQLILNNLNNGEGIEPKDYVLLESVTIQIQKSENTFTLMLNGVTQVTTYTVEAGSSVEVKHVPVEALKPEFYLNGVYIPIKTNLYHTDSKKIYFDESFTFDPSVEGVLVVRYTYETAAEDIITERVTLLNNHYVLMRLFDNIDEATMSGPMDNVYNASGELVQTNSHVSPWSKLSWYQDFEEILIDTIDTDVSLSSIHDGTVMVPLETVGLNADTKMRYWINTNNDRFSLVVMGNPSLDYERDRHLISACYCGRIDSFDNSINDTAGNFALFTSSSTEPCNTAITTEKSIKEVPKYILSEEDVDKNSYDLTEFRKFLEEHCVATDYMGNEQHVIQLTDKTYFNKEVWPKFVLVDQGTMEPVSGLLSVVTPEFNSTEGKSDVLKFNLDMNHIGEQYENCKVYVLFSYYNEKYVITSGVSRDIFGNVIDVDKVKDYGVNTSDGVTSVMMYHTRSKAYYQKHHMLFATTEEYMSKVMYGKSSYTGEYYADRIKITHGNDGPRGTLSDLLVIDSASLYALDELVINKDFEKDPDEYEETFVFFPISAPYSPLSDSPNARYGMAIKKQEVEPRYSDEEIILALAMESLGYFTEHWKNVSSDIYPRNMVDECSVYWSVVKDSAWIGDENTPSKYSPVQLAVANTSEYCGDLDNKITATTGVTLEQGALKANTTNSFLKIKGFTANAGEIIAYGISDKEITSFGTGAQLKVVLYDGTEENEAFEYSIQGVPYTAEIGESLPTTDIQLTDAAPNKYLTLYSVKEVEENSEKKYTITKFACVPLKDAAQDDNWLLQYPCSVSVYSEGGQGRFIHNNARVGSITTTVNYDDSFNLVLSPEKGYIPSEVTIIDANTLEEVEKITSFDSTIIGDTSYQSTKLDNITKNLQIRVLFKAE